MQFLERCFVRVEKIVGRYAVVILIVIAIVTHLQWFNPTSTLMFSDWRNRDNSAMSDILNMSRSTWMTQEHLGQQNVQLYNFAPTYIWGLVGNFDLGVKITLLWPIAIMSVLGPFFLARKLTGRRGVAFLVALLYGFNSYLIIVGTNHLPIAFVTALAPFVLLSFMRLVERPGFLSALLFAFIFSLGVVQELRIMMLISIALGVYTLFNLRVFKNIWLYISILLILLFNVFWLLPLIFGGAGDNVSSIANRGIFGNWLFDLPSALTLFAWRWTGDLPVLAFIPQPIQFYFWILPVVAILALCALPKLGTQQRKLALFFCIVLLIGVLFGKQAAAPLPRLYEWFYAHIPGFNLFREASKFFLLIAVGYLGLTAFGLQYLFERFANRRLLTGVVVAVILLPVVFLAWPLVTSKVGTMHVDRHVPDDYKKFRSSILSEQTSFRTLWIPRSTGWGVFNDLHPRIDAGETGESAWKDLIPPDTGAVLSPTLEMLKSPIGQKIINDSAVKYVVVPMRDPENDDDFYHDFGDDKQYYIDELDKVSWLKHLDFGKNDIAVYENKTYTSPISAFTHLTAFPDATNIRTDFKLASQVSAEPFSFLTADHSKAPSYSSKSQDVFSNLSPKNIVGNKLHVELPYTNPIIYGDTNRPAISYEIKNKILRLSATHSDDVVLNGTTHFTPNKDAEIARVSLDPARNYFVLLDNEAIPVSASDGQRSLGVAHESARLVSSDSTNLVPDASFEQGLWEKEVKDCNNYDNQPRISMTLDPNSATDGTNSLVLSSYRHTACTDSAQIPVEPGKSYLLSFDYKTDGVGQMEYRVTYAQKPDKNIRDRISGGSKDWRTLTRVVTVPQDVTSLTLKLVGLPNLKYQQMVSTAYDNVRLAPLKEESEATTQFAPQYQPIQTGTDSVRVEYDLSKYDLKNLIPNPSLEQGNWQNTVGDCNSYDNNSQVTMRQSDISSDGKKSLEIAAKRHNACTGPPRLPIRDNTTYLLSFDYQSPNQAKAGYYIGFNDKNKTSTSERFAASSDWKNYSTVIKTPSGANELNLVTYAFADEFASDYMTVRYDNFRLIEIPDLTGRYFATEQSAQLTPPASTSYTQLNATKKTVQIKGARTPFYLAMSEVYHPNWQLSVNQATASHPIAAGNHFKLNTFANGWYVDVADVCDKKRLCSQNSDGSYDLSMTIEFTPQKYFYAGLAVSGIAVGASLLVASCCIYRSYRNKEEWRSRT